MSLKLLIMFYNYQVYEAVIRWVKHDIEGRKQTLAPLLAKVKLPLLPASYLTQVIIQLEELSTQRYITTTVLFRTVVVIYVNTHFCNHKLSLENILCDYIYDFRRLTRL